MPTAPPPSLLPTSALALGVDAFVGVRAAVAGKVADLRAAFEYTLAAPSRDTAFFVFAGLDPLLESLERFRPKADELNWLESIGALHAASRRRLAESRFGCDVHAPPEGTIVFPGEALITIEGPYWQGQLVRGLVEAALGESTLTATKMARCSLAAGGAQILETGSAGLHRLGGSPLLARAAFVGGAHATTNALAARRFGIPVRALQPGVALQAYPQQTMAYEAWLAAAPVGATLRIDGRAARASLERAVAAVRQRGKAESWDDGRVAVEIAWGDRAEMAAEVRRAFASLGLAEPFVVASRGGRGEGAEMDEHWISSLASRTAAIGAFAVSARTDQDPAALARYDLVAIEEEGAWSPRVRVGETALATGDPGRKVLLRFSDAEGRPVADIAHLTNERLLRPRDGRYVERDTGFPARLQGATTSAPLHETVMRAGKRVAAPESATAIRERVEHGIALLPERYKRLRDPVPFPVGLTNALAALKAELVGQRTA
jgi:nicotinate phosphoribosyltransferase